MGYTETSETAIGYTEVAGEEQQFRGAYDSRDKKMRHDKKSKKKRRCLFLCCSNMEFEDEEDREKAFGSMEFGEKSKFAVVMCCSNFSVGPKKDLEVPGMKFGGGK